MYMYNTHMYVCTQLDILYTCTCMYNDMVHVQNNGNVPLIREVSEIVERLPVSVSQHRL